MLQRAAFYIVALLTLADGRAVSDAWLTLKAKLALTAVPGVSSIKVHVDTTGGVIALFGKVPSKETKTAAEHRIAKLDGVKRVENLLQIVSPAEEPAVDAKDAEVKADAEKALRENAASRGMRVIAVDKGVLVLGGKARDVAAHLSALDSASHVRGVRRVETRVDVENDAPVFSADGRATASTAATDAWIAAQVKLKLLGEKDVPSLLVRVDTNDGIVTLFGTVSSEAQKRAIAQAAGRVVGVRKVQNELCVDRKRKSDRVADKAIEADVRRLLSREDLESVRVAVKDGVVRIGGTVASENDRIRAAMLSRSAKGARAVKNELEVETNE
jgi:hyperosmotically inducible protein